MALYNKDGTLYRLQGPNPIMKTQVMWTNFVLHNMKWDSEKSEDLNPIVPSPPPIKVSESFISELEVVQPEIKVVESASDLPPVESKSQEIKVIENKPETPSIEIAPKPPVQKTESTKVARQDDDIEKTFIHVLPATIKNKKDHLYGDSYQTIQYLKPTSFEGVILEHDDIFFKVWTDTNQFQEGSVLYPKMQIKRWWRVQEVISQAGGYILICMPSDYQPSFDF